MLPKLSLKPPTVPCVVRPHVGGDVHARCEPPRGHVSTPYVAQKPPAAPTTGGELTRFSTKPSLSPCLPEHNLSFISQQKTNIKCTSFCFTSSAVYLPGPRSLLFLHVPDIIIAVRGMIICLLWKLADCLSPVPEELPLKGVPLEKRHKVASAALEHIMERTEQLGSERKQWRERERKKQRESGNGFMLERLFIQVHPPHSLLCFSS